MRSASIALLAACIFGGLGAGLARAQDAASAELALIGKGRITFADATMVKFTDGRLESQSVTYRPDRSREVETSGLDRVLRVERQTGNSGLGYALAGALCCGLGATMGVNTDTQGIEVDSGVKTAIVGGLTALGAIVGYAVGAGQKHYKTAYENPALEQTSAAPAPVSAAGAEVCLVAARVRF